MRVIGLDIGGANLKACDSDGHARSRVFPMWTQHERLASTLAAMLGEFAKSELLAVTMTAELADCFATKAEGVTFLLDAVQRAADDRQVVVWQTGGEFITPDDAYELPELVAAANWHALATWAGRIAPAGRALLVDIGSTTTDLIPIENGLPVPAGRTDVTRLQSGELVYTGVRRTPLCAVARSVPFRGADTPLAAELFATTLDVYLLLGETEEDPHDHDTANGRPATIAGAHDRLARMLCCDRDEVSRAEAVAIARLLADRQLQQLHKALDRVVGRLGGPCEYAVISGSGGFLAERLVRSHPPLADTTLVPLARSLPQEVAEGACAFAVARLAAERLGPLLH